MDKNEILENYRQSLKNRVRKTRNNYVYYAKLFMDYLEKKDISPDKADEKTVRSYAKGDGSKRRGALRILRFYRPVDFAYLDEPERSGLSKSFSEFLDRYMGHIAARGVSERSIIITRSYLRRFLEYIEEKGITDIREITKKEVSDYSMHIFLYRFSRKKRGETRAYSTGTRAQIIIHIRNFFKFFKKLGLVLCNPAVEVPLPRMPAPLSREVPAVSEVDRILSIIDKSKMAGLRNYAMIETLYSTGLRAAELIRLKIEDIDFERRFISVRKGKYGKPRTVPGSAQAFSAIAEYINLSRPRIIAKQPFDEGVLFLDIKYGTSITTQTVEYIIKNCARKAGIRKHFIPHSFRYACATHMMKNGADIRFIQEMLGHEKLRTTQGYTRVVKEDLKRMIREYHPRELDWTGDPEERKQEKAEGNS